MAPPTTPRRSVPTSAVVFDARGMRRKAEQVVGEEPLEIRVKAPRGEVVATTATMRTPGADFALAAGLLHAEGVIAEAGDVAQIRYCADAGQQQYNVVTMQLSRPPRRDLAARTLMATASCGVCGTSSIDELCERVAVNVERHPVDAALLASLPDRLRDAQPLFDRTGGLHAAGLFDRHGGLIAAHEDVGRHNALDKVLGERFLAGALPAPGAIAVLSGRVSFELVQKVAAAGVPVICAVSAPSSLAVQTAQRLGITLAGFVREGRLTVYSHAGRVRAAAPAGRSAGVAA